MIALGDAGTVSSCRSVLTVGTNAGSKPRAISEGDLESIICQGAITMAMKTRSKDYIP